MIHQGYIFDLDGVLVDTAVFHYQAWKRLALEWFSYPFTEEENERFKGVNRIACMRILCDLVNTELSPEAFERGMALKNAWYVELVETMKPSDVLAGAREFVESARKAGIRCAIGSASKNCALVLQKTGLNDLFDVVADGLVSAKAKPDPEVFLYAAKRLNIAPVECIVFEDAQAGIDAAKASGMHCCAIGKPEDLFGYDWIFPSLGEIKELL